MGVTPSSHAALWSRGTRRVVWGQPVSSVELPGWLRTAVPTQSPLQPIRSAFKNIERLFD